MAKSTRYWFIVDSILQKLVKSSENISLIAHAVPVLVTKVTLESQMSVCPFIPLSVGHQNPFEFRKKVYLITDLSDF